MPVSELDALLAKVPTPMAELTRRIRALILETQPGIGERVWPGWKAVGFGNGSAMSDYVCMLSPASKWVRVSFMRTDVPDPTRLLEPGPSSAAGHHMRLASEAELEQPAVRALLAAAFALGPSGAGRPARAERAPGSNRASASKTVNVPVDALYHAWTDKRTRTRWLPEPFVVRKATENRSLRITWADGSSVEALFLVKSEGKSAVQLDHDKLADAEAVERARAFWKERLASLKTLLEA